MSKPIQVHDAEFKAAIAQRILDGESVSALRQELGVKRSVLYRWRDAYRKDGIAGLRAIGRPPGMPKMPRASSDPELEAARRIAELERKIGQQAMDIDFFRRAFKRVKESRRSNTSVGATASTERSEA